jgi:hypothetical protein
MRACRLHGGRLGWWPARRHKKLALERTRTGEMRPWSARLTIVGGDYSPHYGALRAHPHLLPPSAFAASGRHFAVNQAHFAVIEGVDGTSARPNAATSLIALFPGVLFAALCPSAGAWRGVRELKVPAQRDVPRPHATLGEDYAASWRYFAVEDRLIAAKIRQFTANRGHSEAKRQPIGGLDGHLTVICLHYAVKGAPNAA